jgi:hypothetical protein
MEQTMTEAILIFQNMRGGCATVGNTVHTLFRVNGRRPGMAAAAAGDTAPHLPEPPTAAASAADRA